MKKKNDGIVFRRGKRVILRPLEKGDVPMLTQFINNPEVSQYLLKRDPVMILQEERWIEELAQKSDHWVLGIALRKSGELIGTMGLGNIDWIARHGTTGSLIGEERYRGRGYGTEAKMLLLEWAFNELNLRKVFSRALDFNGRSIRYSEKCGYREEARIREFLWKGGKLRDEIILSVSQENFLQLWEKFKKTNL